MTSARDDILGKVRSAITGRTDVGPRGLDVIQARMAAHKVNLIPKRGADDADVVSRFIFEAERASADVQCLSSIQDVPVAISQYLITKKSTGAVVVADHPQFRPLKWQETDKTSYRIGQVHPLDLMSVTVAVSGIAETGTLMMSSSPQSPAMLNVVPIIHGVILNKSDIVGSYEDAWAKLRSLFVDAEDNMPRAMNYITGPSRTADIEQELLMGAHGPQQLSIMIIEDQ